MRCIGRYAMPVSKFKNFEDVDKVEKQGKGISWRFTPDETYLNKVLRFQIRVPFHPGVYKFKTFEEAEVWEREWWIKSRVTTSRDQKRGKAQRQRRFTFSPGQKRISRKKA